MNIALAERDNWSRLQSTMKRLRSLPVQTELRITVGVLLAYAAVLLLILVLPGRTYLGQYANDFMIFVDGADRIVSGQIPNRDFHTPLGPLAFLLPAYGLWAGGSIGAMMPLATAAFTFIFAPLIIYVAATRLPLGWALAFGMFMLLLVIAPLNPGEPPDRTSYAMFYNRQCWAMLSTLFLMILPNKFNSKRVWDATVIAALLLLMLYIKISYAAIALVFVAGLLMLREMRATALLGLALTAAGVSLVHLFWGATGTYIADIRVAGEASGALRGTLFTVGRSILDNLTDCVLVAGLFAVAWLRGAHPNYLFFALYMVLTGLVLINQNAQQYGIITLISAALVMIFAPVEKRTPVRADRYWPAFVGALVLAAIAIPPAAMNLVTLGYNSVKSAQSPSGDPYEERLDGLVTTEGNLRAIEPGADVLPSVYRTGLADLETFNMVRHARYRQPVGQTEYLRSLEEAVRILSGDSKLAGRVFTLDMANPLNALAGRTPPTGIDAWNHLQRTFSPDIYRAPEVQFANIDVVMWPKLPVELATFQALRRLYGPYIESHYRLVTESTYWRAYRRKTD